MPKSAPSINLVNSVKPRLLLVENTFIFTCSFFMYIIGTFISCTSDKFII